MQMTANLEGFDRMNAISRQTNPFSFTIISLCLHNLSIFSDGIQSFAPNLWRHHELHPITGGVKREMWNEKRENVCYFLFLVGIILSVLLIIVEAVKLCLLEIKKKNYSVLLACTCVDYTIEVFQVLFLNNMGVPLQKQNVSTSQYK